MYLRIIDKVSSHAPNVYHPLGPGYTSLVFGRLVFDLRKGAAGEDSNGYYAFYNGAYVGHDKRRASEGV